MGVCGRFSSEKFKSAETEASHDAKGCGSSSDTYYLGNQEIFPNEFPEKSRAILSSKSRKARTLRYPALSLAQTPAALESDQELKAWFFCLPALTEPTTTRPTFWLVWDKPLPAPRPGLLPLPSQ